MFIVPFKMIPSCTAYIKEITGVLEWLHNHIGGQLRQLLLVSDANEGLYGEHANQLAAENLNLTAALIVWSDHSTAGAPWNAIYKNVLLFYCWDIFLWGFVVQMFSNQIIRMAIFTWHIRDKLHFRIYCA